ncbi:uncharacterized protein TRIADDRAFT_18229, partial [Trichoplax adhaerens]
NLSAADLLMGLYLIIIASANVYFAGHFSQYHEVWLRSPFCLVSSFLVSVSTLMSTLIMFIITVDRFLFLVYPFHNYRLSRRLVIFIFVIFWSIAVMFAGIPLLYGNNQPPYNRLYATNAVCLPGNIENPILQLWLLTYCGVTFIIWIIISIMYFTIIIDLTKSRKAARRKISTLEKIVLAKMITIVATDLICWLPLYIVLIRGIVISELETHLLTFVAVLSLPLNSCINPILYTMFTKTFIDHTITIMRNFICCFRITESEKSNNLKKNQAHSFNRRKYYGIYIFY